MYRLMCLTPVLTLCLSPLGAVGAERIHPRVPGYERFYAPALSKPATDADDPTETPEPAVELDPVTGGRILLSELNCLSCHLPDDQARVRLTPKKAPILDEVGKRIKVDWLRKYLASPHAMKPGTTMPDLIAALPESEKATSVEALTAFLASTGTVLDVRTDQVAAKKGANLFRTVGCLACHNSVEDNSPDLATSSTWPDLAKKYSSSSLMEFLKDPLKVRPSGRMPVVGLTDEEIRCVANFFIQDGNTSPNVNYVLYEGRWNQLPKFDELKPIAKSATIGFDLTVAGSRTQFALRFMSHLWITKAGEYKFRLGSNDGARLSIDGQVVVDCDGEHSFQRQDNSKTLPAGFHSVAVDYFNAGGESQLVVEISGPDLLRQPLSGLVYLEPRLPSATPSTADQPLNASLIPKGRELFATLGCASCHQLTVEGTAIASRISATPLSKLTTNGGCLAETPAGRAPRFGLNTAQRASLASVLKSNSDEPPAETAHRILATLNCYACHERGRLGGVELTRNASFESLQKEMGDEGRLPPALTGVGDKLRPDWLRHILTNSGTDRKHYLVTKMPKFGTPNLEVLAEVLIAVDQRSDKLPAAEFAEPAYRVKAAGRHLVGGQALSCIKCHDFGTHPSTGVRAINLTTMTSRLRPEWFYRYVLDPQEYRRGTRMPAPWPFGTTTIRDVLNADVNLQVQAVWMYLSDRDLAAVPSGLIRESIELKPESEPIIYRNFVQGAGTRAIAVGYPEKVNLAFDANEMRLAMIWHGAFIDASRHWTGRGQGFEPPLGDDLIPLPNRFPFLKLENPEKATSPESGRLTDAHFHGYRLDTSQRPVFNYSIPGIRVEDAIEPHARPNLTTTLKRTLQFTGAGDSQNLWFEAAEGDKIATLAEGRYRIDDIWTIEINLTEATRPLVLESAGKRRLIVPIRLKDGNARVQMNYVW